MTKLSNTYEHSWPLKVEASSDSLINCILKDLRDTGFGLTADKISELINESVEEDVILIGKQQIVLRRSLTEYEKMEVTTTIFTALWQEMISAYGKLRRDLGRDEKLEESIFLAGEVVEACQIWLRTHVPYGDS